MTRVTGKIAGILLVLFTLFAAYPTTASATVPDMPEYVNTMQQGNSGSVILNAQVQYNVFAFHDHSQQAPTTGIFGADFRLYVIHFQQRMGIGQSGIIDPQTWYYLSGSWRYIANNQYYYQVDHNFGCYYNPEVTYIAAIYNYTVALPEHSQAMTEGCWDATHWTLLAHWQNLVFGGSNNGVMGPLTLDYLTTMHGVYG